MTGDDRSSDALIQLPAHSAAAMPSDLYCCSPKAINLQARRCGTDAAWDGRAGKLRARQGGPPTPPTYDYPQATGRNATQAINPSRSPTPVAYAVDAPTSCTTGLCLCQFQLWPEQHPPGEGMGGQGISDFISHVTPPFTTSQSHGPLAW